MKYSQDEIIQRIQAFLPDMVKQGKAPADYLTEYAEEHNLPPSVLEKIGQVMNTMSVVNEISNDLSTGREVSAPLLDCEALVARYASTEVFTDRFKSKYAAASETHFGPGEPVTKSASASGAYTVDEFVDKVSEFSFQEAAGPDPDPVVESPTASPSGFMAKRSRITRFSDECDITAQQLESNILGLREKVASVFTTGRMDYSWDRFEKELEIEGLDPTGDIREYIKENDPRVTLVKEADDISDLRSVVDPYGAVAAVQDIEANIAAYDEVDTLKKSAGVWLHAFDTEYDKLFLPQGAGDTTDPELLEKQAGSFLGSLGFTPQVNSQNQARQQAQATMAPDVRSLMSADEARFYNALNRGSPPVKGPTFFEDEYYRSATRPDINPDLDRASDAANADMVFNSILLTDENLQDADPDDLYEIFETIRQFSPEIVKSPVAVRNILRQASQLDSVDPETIKVLTDIHEKHTKGTQQQEALATSRAPKRPPLSGNREKATEEKPKSDKDKSKSDKDKKEDRKKPKPQGSQQGSGSQQGAGQTSGSQQTPQQAGVW